jgi:hypothetical protein
MPGFASCAGSPAAIRRISTATGAMLSLFCALALVTAPVQPDRPVHTTLPASTAGLAATDGEIEWPGTPTP